MKKIKFTFNKSGAKKATSFILRFRYLLFFAFFSAFLAFTFGFMYKYIYADTNFSEYEESYESQVMLEIKANNRILKEILNEIKQRNEKLMKREIDYNNPFRFSEDDVLEINEVDDINNSEENDFASPPLLTAP